MKLLTKQVSAYSVPRLAITIDKIKKKQNESVSNIRTSIQGQF